MISIYFHRKKRHNPSSFAFLQGRFFHFCGGTGIFCRSLTNFSYHYNGAFIVSGQLKLLHLLHFTAQLLNGKEGFLQLLFNFIALQCGEASADLHKRKTVFGQLPKMSHRTGTGDIILFPVFFFPSYLFRPAVKALCLQRKALAQFR